MRSGHFDNYNALSNPQERIFALKKSMEEFGKPNPIKTPKKFKNREKLCAYHNETEHNTSECWALRDAIEDLIRRGQLRDYVITPVNQLNQQPTQVPPPPGDECAPAVQTIYTIHDKPHLAGTFHNSHERYVREANHVLLAGSSEQVGFTKRTR